MGCDEMILLASSAEQNRECAPVFRLGLLRAGAGLMLHAGIVAPALLTSLGWTASDSIAIPDWKKVENLRRLWLLP
ncbi:MAG: hypothetical protein JWM59_2629 [Verrucomicrobiales bacterium]|nr:hypothetical protein [Verrucomicrobiales bacterium]